MNRTQTTLLLLLVLIAAFIAVLALRNPQAPILPRDSDHVRFKGAEACLSCHGPGTSHAQSKNHPVGNDCMRCHGMP